MTDGRAPADQVLQPKLFPVSKNLGHRVVSSTQSPNRVEYVQEQEYTVRFIGSKKIMYSLVVIDLDDQGKVVKVEDRWNAQDHPTRWGTYVRVVVVRC